MMNSLVELYGGLRKFLMIMLALSFFVQSCASEELHYAMKKERQGSSRRSIFGGRSSFQNSLDGFAIEPRTAGNKTEGSIDDNTDSVSMGKNDLSGKNTKSSGFFWGSIGGVVGLLVGFGITFGVTYSIMNGKINSAQGLYDTCETQFSAFKSSSNHTNSLSNCQNSLNTTSTNLNFCQNSLNTTSTQLSTCSSNLANCILGSNTPGTSLSACNAALNTMTADYTECITDLTNCAISTSMQVNTLATEISTTVQLCQSKLSTLCQDSIVTNHLNAIGSHICS